MGIVYSALKRDLLRTRAVLSASPVPAGEQRKALGEHVVWMMEFLHHTSEDESSGVRRCRAQGVATGTVGPGARLRVGLPANGGRCGLRRRDRASLMAGSPRQGRRAYRSPRRQEQAAETRALVLSAASTRLAVRRAPRLLDQLFARLIPSHQDRDVRLTGDLVRLGAVARREAKI